MRIKYDDLTKIQALNHRRDADGNDFGFNTCCDYVEHIDVNGALVGVTIFVEPCGDITKWGDNLSDILDWWIAVFKLQPEHWGYIPAGHHLYDLFEADKLPDDPAKVWPVVIDALSDLPKLKGVTP